MNTIRFTVYGHPKPQPRVKAYRKGNHASVYTPDSANDWKSLVYLEACKHRPDDPLEGPVRVVLCFYLPRPKRLMRKKDIDESIPATGGGDIDNLAKLVLDVLTDAGYWSSDQVVYLLEAEKRYCWKGDNVPLMDIIIQGGGHAG